MNILFSKIFNEKNGLLRQYKSREFNKNYGSDIHLNITKKL